MKKVWWLLIIAIDVALTNLHHLWAKASVEDQWHVWDSSVAARVCLIPVVMMLQQKLDKWGELAVANYFAFAVLDMMQTIAKDNNGFQFEELLAYILLNAAMITKWKTD